MAKTQDLPIIQKTYDLIKWYVPILNRLPRDHKFILGDRMIAGLYELLDGCIQARYSQNKLPQLELLNSRLDHGHTWHLRQDIFRAWSFTPPCDRLNSDQFGYP